MVQLGADGPAEVGLVGEPQIGGEGGEVALAVFQALQGAADADAVAVAGQRHAELAGEGSAEPIWGDAEQVGEGEQPMGCRVIGGDRLAGGRDPGPVGAAGRQIDRGLRGGDPLEGESQQVE